MRVPAALAAAGLLCAVVAAVGGEGEGGGTEGQANRQQRPPVEATARPARVAPVVLVATPDARPPDADGLPEGEPASFGVTSPGTPDPAFVLQPPPPVRPVGPDAPPPPPGAGVPAPGARYAWPLLPPPVVLAPFRAPPHVYGRGHRGVDLAGAPGQPVLAARAGSVVFAGPVGGRGVVSVHHDDGLRTTYEPVRPVVATGAFVRAGEVIGLLVPGHPGCAAASCLHWGVRRERTDYLDPLVLVRPPRVRLLPVPDPWPLGGGGG